MVFLKHFMLAASIGIGTLLLCSPASATQIVSYPFNGLRTLDGDSFNLILSLEVSSLPSDPSSLSSQHFGPTDLPLSGLHTDAYDFTGYTVTSISGSWYEAEAPTVALIVQNLQPIGSIVDHAIDTMAHALTDNLFNPKQEMTDPLSPIQLSLGKFSYGGIAFEVVKPDSTIEIYQLFTDPATGDYSGCPGTCSVVKEVDGPVTLPLMGVGGLVFAWSRSIRRRVDTAKGQGRK